MRAVVQRVTEAAVRVDGELVGSIGPGLCVLVGVTHADGTAEADKLAAKLWSLRVFDDEQGRMELGADQVGGAVLVISQFTLYGDTRKGRRPSWIEAARPEQAEPLVERVATQLRTAGATVATGRFGAEMQVSIVNDGPVTLIVET